MKLITKLWIAIAVITAIAFVGSFSIMARSSQVALIEQLSKQNSDNSQSLALSLSQVAGDPVQMELQISSQFDTGHYAYIRLLSPEGKELYSKAGTAVERGSLLSRLLPIVPQLGRAQVSNGWQQLGSLELQVQTQFAYRALKATLVMMVFYFVVFAIFLGLLGRLFLSRINQTLSQVVEQADALGQWRFISLPVPKIIEFKRLVEAMNALSLRLKEQLDSDSSRLALHKAELENDALTGALEREAFIRELSSRHARQNDLSQGLLLIIRAHNLMALNRHFGRAKVDLKLQGLVELIRTDNELTITVGRLNGSDFSLLIELSDDLEQELDSLFNRLNNHYCADLPAGLSHLSAGYTYFGNMNQAQQVLTWADEALAKAEATSNSLILSSGRTLPSLEQDKDWQSRFSRRSLEVQDLQPCLRELRLSNKLGRLNKLQFQLDLEAEQAISSGRYLPWFRHQGRMLEFDLCQLESALLQASKNDFNGVLAITLNTHHYEVQQLCLACEALFERYSVPLDKLCVMFPEQCLSASLVELADVMSLFKQAGFYIGVEHIHHQLGSLAQLYQLGLDLISIDYSLLHGVSESARQQILVQGIVNMANTLGAAVIADGEHSEKEWQYLESLGVQGQTI
ncbi:LapD/MoxY N-terminal periplasmic domain-containing protein [Agaribacterium sp. ZY112]|uniref:bifunctional diguanylate cyclase/phosphodiesterase n=1 Tax=Agaribacterium sp. ZY112 TaxID=3233574 RepID=UPI0035234EBF